MNDAKLDLDLLRFFCVLMRTRALHRAAEHLEMSQPAASRALQRLRVLLGDKLFVKAGQGMVPTPRSVAVAPAIEEALAKVEALVAPERFDPATSRRTFRLAMMDNAIVVSMLPMLAKFERLAPHASLEICPLETDYFEQLRSGRTELVIFPPRHLPPDCHRVELVRSDYLCLLRAGHPLVAGTPAGTRPDLDEFRRYRRVTVKARHGSMIWQVDSRAVPGLEGAGTEIVTHYFLSVPMFVAESDLIAILPRPTAERFARDYGLATLPTPLPCAAFRTQLIWHDRVNADPAITWLRGLILDSVRKSRRRAAGAAT